MSNDNPYSEAQFKTLKYQPDFPQRFASIEHARAFIARDFAALLAEVRSGGMVGQDHKSALQEYLQSHDQALPEYRLTGTVGPDHRKLFEIAVVVRGETIAQGRGASKKEAEQEAARLALEALRQ